jgi:hypothetical protein
VDAISFARPDVSDKAVVGTAILVKGVTAHNFNIVWSQELVIEF